MKKQLKSDGPLRAVPCSPSLAWKPITEPPTENFGWYAAAVLPVNHAELDAAGINSWRAQFGFTKVWYSHSGSHGSWWEPDPHGNRSKPISDRMTHWAELPPVPLIPENAIGEARADSASPPHNLTI